MGVWRVGKDDVEFLVGSFQKVENIGADHMDVLYVEPLGCGLDEVGALGVDFDGCHGFDTTGNEFERYGTSSGKEVHRVALFIIDIVVEDVEKAFARHVGGGTDWQIVGRIESATFQGTCNDTHERFGGVRAVRGCVCR